MSDRLAEIDCVQARTQTSVGVSAPQTVWLYDRPVDMSQLTTFHESLKRGRLGRAVAPAVFGAAGDRWTAKPQFAPIEVESRSVARAELEDWLDEQGNAEIAAYGGPAWRLAVTALDDGGSAVSLLVSHAIADGLSVSQAIIDAVDGRTLDFEYASDEYSTLRLWSLDAAAAIRQLSRVARWQLAQLFAAIVSRRKAVNLEEQAPEAVSGDAAESHPEADNQFGPLDVNFHIPRVTALIPAPDWSAAADARGGSTTTLAIAVAADLAAALGRTSRGGDAHIAMPISTRTGDSDTRANAVRGIRFEVDTNSRLAADLRPLRAKVGRLLRNSAVRPDLDAHSMVAYLTIPRPKLARLAWSSAVPDFTTTGFMTLGKLDRKIAQIDGRDSTSMAATLINRAIEDPTRLARYGGNLWLGIIEVAEVMSLRVAGFDPRTPLIQTKLREEVAATLGEYGLTATFW